MNGSQTGWGSSYRNPKFLERFRSPESSKSQGSWWSSPFQKGKEKTVGYCWLRLTLSDEAQRSGFRTGTQRFGMFPGIFVTWSFLLLEYPKPFYTQEVQDPQKKSSPIFGWLKFDSQKKKQSTWWNPTTFNGLLTSRAYLASYFTIQRWVQTHSWTSFIKISKKGMAIHRIWFSELRFMPCPAFFGLATVPRHAVQAHGTFNSTKILGCDGDIFLRMTPVLSNQLSNEKRDPGWLGFFGGLYYPII